MIPKFHYGKEAMERANRLRAIRGRLHKQMSQKAFAARLGVSQSRYSNWEHGSPIPPDQIRNIKRITPGIDADYILWGDTNGLTVEIVRLLEEDLGVASFQILCYGSRETG